MKSGTKLKCRKSFEWKGIRFERGDSHRVIFIDNEKIEIFACIDKKTGTDFILLPIELLKQKFETE